MSDVLRAPHEVAFAYRRSVGGADHRFLSGLARAELWGSRGSDGRVTVPPVDWDPESGAAVDRFIRLGERGVVRSWTWVARPRAEHPLDRPFAIALVQLDGADTSLLHVVDVADQAQMHTGMTVRADWRSERVGSILDLRAFIPGDPDRADHGEAGPSALPEPTDDLEVVSDVVLRYSYEPGLALSRFYRALSQRRIEGGRCPSCAGVYVPPHSTCPTCRSSQMVPVELGDQGVVTAYTVVHLPFHGMTIDLPFVCAWIRLDGADVPFAHLLGEVPADQVEVGQRVEAVWVPEEDLTPSWESIRYFRPLSSGTVAAPPQSPCLA